MNADRKMMELALKQQCVPVLRNLGFKGSFPNFFRDTNNFIALVNFQFYSAGGSFCVNLGYVDRQRANVGIYADTETKNLTVAQTKERCRLGETEGNDRWFSFGETNYGTFRGNPVPVKELALTCSQLLKIEAEQWWLAKQTTDI